MSWPRIQNISYLSPDVKPAKSHIGDFQSCDIIFLQKLCTWFIYCLLVYVYVHDVYIRHDVEVSSLCPPLHGFQDYYESQGLPSKRL